ncbi:hypothetical protein JCM10207_006290 [Rhodosporidiobolus poonsookiae]
MQRVRNVLARSSRHLPLVSLPRPLSAPPPPLLRLASSSTPTLLPASLAQHGRRIEDYGVVFVRPVLPPVEIRPDTRDFLVLAASIPDEAERRESGDTGEVGVRLEGEELLVTTQVRREIVQAVTRTLYSLLEDQGIFQRKEVNRLAHLQWAYLYTAYDAKANKYRLRTPGTPVVDSGPLARTFVRNEDHKLLRPLLPRLATFLTHDARACALYQVVRPMIEWMASSNRNDLAHPPVPPALFSSLLSLALHGTHLLASDEVQELVLELERDADLERL